MLVPRYISVAFWQNLKINHYLSIKNELEQITHST
jgi:hypothetical protein